MLPITLIAGAVLLLLWSAAVRGTPERLRLRRRRTSGEAEGGLPGVGAQYANSAAFVGLVIIFAALAIILVDHGL